VEKSSTMDMQTYLNNNKYTIYTFADQHGLSATTVWRAVKRKVLRPSNALLIEEATGGAVSRMELLYPTANNKGRGADKPKS
jgi:hypothetical protein